MYMTYDKQPKGGGGGGVTRYLMNDTPAILA